MLLSQAVNCGKKTDFITVWEISGTYESLDLLVKVGDFEDLLLQLLDHLLLSLCPLLRHVRSGADLLGPIFVLVVKLGIVLCQLPERLTRRRLDVETLDFLQHITTVHALNDGVHIANHLFFEHLCVMRKDVLLGWLIWNTVLDRIKWHHLVSRSARHSELSGWHTWEQAIGHLTLSGAADTSKAT